MTSPAYEVAVLGATPAGLVAAHYLASHGCQVVLVDAPRESTECPLADWVPRTFFHLPGLPKGLSATLKVYNLTGVTWYEPSTAEDSFPVVRIPHPGPTVSLRLSYQY